MLVNPQLTPHFKLSEFRCRCCGKVDADAALHLAQRLEPVRYHFGPMILISGYRCPSYNKAVGGKSDSRHLRGTAADIRIATDSGRFALLRALLDHGFIRIGIGKSSIHVDTDTPTDPLFWTYYP